MQSVSVSDVTKFDVKNADLSRTQGVCYVIQIIFGSSLGKV